MADSDAPVEQATAAPGEKRDTEFFRCRSVDITGAEIVPVGRRVFAMWRDVGDPLPFARTWPEDES